MINLSGLAYIEGVQQMHTLATRHVTQDCPLTTYTPSFR